MMALVISLCVVVATRMTTGTILPGSMTENSGNGAAQDNGSQQFEPGPRLDEQSDLRHFVLQQAFSLCRFGIVAFTILAGLYLAPGCLKLLRDMVVPFAGEETVFDAQIALSLTLVSGVVNISQALRLHMHRKRAKQLTRLAAELGAELDKLSQKTP